MAAEQGSNFEPSANHHCASGCPGSSFSGVGGAIAMATAPELQLAATRVGGARPDVDDKP